MFIKNKMASTNTLWTNLISKEYQGKDKDEKRKIDKEAANTAPQKDQ